MLLTKLKTKTSTALLLGALSLELSCPPPPSFGQEVRQSKIGRDRYGDNLPLGVIARFGSDRLRAMTESMHFSDDGKTLIGVDQGAIRTWDATNGNFLSARTFADVAGRWGAVARSRDGKTLVLAVDRRKIEVWDVPSGKQVNLPMPENLTSIDGLAISNDRERLFLCDTVVQRVLDGGFSRNIHQEQTLRLWNTSTRETTTFLEKQVSVGRFVIAPDGTKLAVAVDRGTHVWEVASGKALWHDPKFRAEAMQFSSDSRRLIANENGGPVWHVLDAATGKPAAGFTAPDIGYVWTFTLSADDRLLAAPTVTDYVVCDLTTGKVIRRWPGAKQSGKVLFAPDGRSVILYGATFQRYDVATGKPHYVDVDSRGHTGAVRRAVFTPDGNRLISFADDDTLRIWGSRSAELLHTIPLPPVKVDVWALTPDGKTFLIADDKLTIHRWSIDDGKTLSRMELKELQALGRFQVMQLTVSADGKNLVVSAWSSNGAPRNHPKPWISFWDVETARFLKWGADPGDGYHGERARLAPDGQHVVDSDQLYSTTSSQSARLDGTRTQLWPVSQVAFPVDGRYLADAIRNAEPLVVRAVKGEPTVTTFREEYHGVSFWETATAGKILDLAKERSTGDQIHRLVISPDGRWLGLADWDHFTVYDLRGGKIAWTGGRRPTEISNRVGSYWNSGAIAFSPDGTSVVSTHLDGNMLLWPLPLAEFFGKAERVGAKEADDLWEALKGEPKNAYAAHWRLRDDPKATLSLLRRRLLPVQAPPDAELKALFRDLASEKFAIREKAMETLRRHGRSAAAALRAAHKQEQPLEAKRRMETLLFEWSQPAPLTSEMLRHIRAAAVLERLATSEADRLLQQIAAGAPDVLLTKEAQMALIRRGKQ